MIYLDNASTTHPKPPEVVDAIRRFMSEVGASPGRGGYRACNEAERIVVDVRQKLTTLVNGNDPSRMIFTASCTDALNMAIYGVVQDGDHVVTTMLDHNSVRRPLQAMHQDGRITLTQVPFYADGTVDPDEVERAITPKTRLVVLNHASNVTGTIQPAAEMGAIARRHDALFLLDAAQTIGVVDIDIKAWQVDLLAFPAHKELLGPPGLGGLYVGDRADVRPWRQGGTGVDSINPVQPSDWPFVLEAGTPNSVGIAGLQAALEHINPSATLAHLRALLERLLEGMGEEKQFSVVGPADSSTRVGTISIQLADLSPVDAGAILDESFAICVRSGLHCAPDTHRLLGTFPDGAIRISPGPFTTEEEINQTCAALRQICA